MRARLVTAALAAVWLVGMAAAQKLVSTEAELDAAMKAARSAMDAASRAVDAGLLADAGRQLDRLKQIMDETRGFWADHQKDDALAANRGTVAAIEAAQRRLTGRPSPSADAAQAALRDIQAACRICHDAYRTRGPENNWIVKPGSLAAPPAPVMRPAPAAGAPQLSAAVAAAPAFRIDFGRQVEPIFKKNCLQCHSQDKRKGGLSLATYDDLLDGGKDGPVVRPGSSTRSEIIQRVTSGDEKVRMPLDELPLTRADIAVLAQWIDQGARETPDAAPAPQPWEAPLALVPPPVPATVWPAWSHPVDRFVASYLSGRRVAEPALVDDAAFARRAWLDAWGLLPAPEDLQAFLADPAPDKRQRLVTTLLADGTKYAEHWISYWNDLLRNEDGYTYFSDAQGGGRQTITPWLLQALAEDTPYDQMLMRLLNPTEPGDPAGFVIGVNWRGETSAAMTPWMQASQNTAQVFLGVNFKCNACHDSFVSRWKLRDAYGLAAYFAPQPRLQLVRCEIARDEYTEPSFFFKELARPVPSASLADRRATIAAIFTDPRNGRMPRTIVNRIWTKLLGRGFVAQPDEMDGRPWSPELLDWLAADFAANRYGLKTLIRTIMTSRAYQMPAVVRTIESSVRGYEFRGPEVRRVTAEQFADAVGSITGEWGVYTPQGAGAPVGAAGRGAGPALPGVVSLVDQQEAAARERAARASQAAAAVLGGARAGGAAGSAAISGRVGTPPSDPATAGVYAREFRAPSNFLTRALGRPIRDQVVSTRAQEATTLQALELINGEILTRRLMRGAKRLIGERPPDPLALFNGAVAGRNAQARAMDADVSRAATLYLLVSDTGSNAPERVRPAWVNMTLAGPAGDVPLASLAPIDASGLRDAPAVAGRIAVKNNSRLVYDIAGRGFTRLRGELDVDNDRLEIGSTLNPSLRFFVFDVEPNMESLLPPAPALPLPAAPPATTIRAVVDRIFWAALGRAPSPAERQAAETAVADPARPGRPSAAGVADLLWAVMMKPEFQLLF